MTSQRTPMNVNSATHLWEVFKMSEIEESPEPDISNTSVGILTIVNENSTNSVHFSPVSAAVVVEDEIADLS
ncbi:hypothetical protein FQA47_007463 [Oryzias melastigma]|uniref:Uncharacterized protein n=1 Tax=Oryzias melastigma TaxID=30732 RepID=A0A834EYY9_ORYME|nr:hypothetical protein FQA47_007463 [Oryzias melastigma]